MIGSALAVTFSHCRRKNGIGGEDIALDRIMALGGKTTLNAYKAPGNQALGLLSFIFSFRYFLYVIKNRNQVHVICNPFPYVSILSVIFLGMFSIKLRLYLHDFSASCPANTHFRNGRPCFKFLNNKACLRSSCVPTKKHLMLTFFRRYVFFNLFKAFKGNKVYFVSSYQRQLALEAGLPKAQSTVVGNIV